MGKLPTPGGRMRITVRLDEFLEPRPGYSLPSGKAPAGLPSARTHESLNGKEHEHGRSVHRPCPHPTAARSGNPRPRPDAVPVALTRFLPVDLLQDDRVQRFLEIVPLQELEPVTWAVILGALGLTLTILIWVLKGEMVVARLVWLGFILFVGAGAYWGYRTLGPSLGTRAQTADTGPALARSDTAANGGETGSYHRSQAVFQREAQNRGSRGDGRASPRRGRTDDREEPAGGTSGSPENPDAPRGTYERALDRAERTYETFQGSGETKTASFSVPTEWSVLWQNSAHENAFFTIYVLEDGEKIKSVGSHLGTSAGLSETFPPGTYSLRIHGTESWTVKVLEPN